MTQGAAGGAQTTVGRESGKLKLEHSIAFSLGSALGEAEARAFVRDVPRSLRHADFLSSLSVLPGDPPVVAAELPVNAAMFGMRSLPFESEVRLTSTGARLTPRPLPHHGAGWAEVAGEARVGGAGAGSRLDYSFAITVHLAMPNAERWGTQALMKMIELTAASVLRRVLERFPAALELAASEAARPVLSDAGA